MDEHGLAPGQAMANLGSLAILAATGIGPQVISHRRSQLAFAYLARPFQTVVAPFLFPPSLFIVALLVDFLLQPLRSLPISHHSPSLKRDIALKILFHSSIRIRSVHNHVRY